VTLRYDLHGAEPGRVSRVALLVHGGPIPADLEITPADWGLFQSLARVLAASGSDAVMFNHRFFSPEAAMTATNDLEDLMSYLGAERSIVAFFFGATPAKIDSFV
jgi:hypothetical protein